MRYKAAWLFEQGLPCGAEANMAKLLGRRGVVGGRERLPRHARRLRLRRGVRRRAQVPRDAPLQGRAGLEQPDPRLRRPARARHAALLLMQWTRSAVERGERAFERSRSSRKPMKTRRERWSPSSGQASRWTGGCTTCWTPFRSSGPAAPTSSSPLTRKISEPRAWSSIVSQIPNAVQSIGSSSTTVTARRRRGRGRCRCPAGRLACGCSTGAKRTSGLDVAEARLDAHARPG